MTNLKYYRTKKGLDQLEIARQIGVSKQAYSNYELGKRQASHEILVKLARILDTSVDNLLTGSPAQSEAEPLPTVSTYQIPVFESVSAGFGAYADDRICGYMPLFITSDAEARRECSEVRRSNA